MAESRHDSIRRRWKENGFLDLKAEVLMLGPYSPRPLNELSLVSFPPYLRFFLPFFFFLFSLSFFCFVLFVSGNKPITSCWGHVAWGYPSHSSLLAVVAFWGLTHSHGSPGALGAVPSLAPSWGNLFSFLPLGFLRVRGGWRAYHLGMHLSAGNQQPNLECLK